MLRYATNNCGYQIFQKSGGVSRGVSFILYQTISGIRELLKGRHGRNVAVDRSCQQHATHISCICWQYCEMN